MNDLLELMLPELILAAVAGLLMLLGVSARTGVRRAVPILALLAVLAVFGIELWSFFSGGAQETRTGGMGALVVGPLAHYVKLLASGVGILLVLLAWPTNANATGSRSMELGQDVGEFFGLMLLSLAGVLLVSSANSLILLFLAIELASIPTYVMVSMSRPLAVAQEAGVKYFFLGAMAAAVMLLGFSYLYGTTGVTKLDQIANSFAALRGDASGAPAFTHWQTLALLMLIAGFAFKLAAVPLHAYAGDVYQGAATPVTAFLAFVPKTAGMIALVRVLAAVGGPGWDVPAEIASLMWVVAVLTMTFGNVLGLLQTNVKRLLAYSSVAHSGYMLVGVTALLSAGDNTRAEAMALQGVLFYLAAYGIMNAAAFGVLMLLPSRAADMGAADANEVHSVRPPATSAENFEDLAGQGRRHVALGLAMAVACFSLIGLPLTVGFWGKVYLIKPALDARLYWLVALTMVNAAIGAAYYLRIVATMFLRTDPATAEAMEVDIAESPKLAHPITDALPVVASVALSVVLTLVFGAVIPATERLSQRAREAAATPVTGARPNAATAAGAADDASASAR